MKNARGSILVISTLMLAMLAGLSIGTLQNVVTEYQLSTQDADKTLALESAQYALAEAKRLILTDWSPGAPTCPTISPCNPNNSNGIAVWNYGAFKNASDFSRQPASYFNAAQPTAAKPLASLAAAPRFFVIDLGCDVYSKANIYRILAQGYGNSINSVAYAESQLTMPLSGQNSYANAPTTALVGVGASNTAITHQSYNLALSTNSKNLFFNNGGGATCSNPGQRLSTGATCEMNCLGQVRVKGYSAYNGTGCPWIYSDWVPASNQSVLQLNNSATPGDIAVLSCGPCQTSMTLPNKNVCNSGQYNSCTGSCVLGCTGGQVWNGNTCACLANQTWSGTLCQCNAGYQQTGGNAQTGFVCSACPAGQSSSLGGSCAQCAAGKFSPAGAGSCAQCAAGYYSGAGAGSCAQCGAGYYSGTGAGSCAQCPADTFSPAGAGSCTPCPANQLSPAGSTSVSSCVFSCSIYAYVTPTGCAICQPGTYQVSSTGPCAPCPAGTWNSVQGAKGCGACRPGTYSGSGANWCTQCPANTYSDAGASGCTACPAGQTSPAGSSNSGACVCPSGRTWSGSCCAICVSTQHCTTHCTRGYCYTGDPCTTKTTCKCQ